MRGVDILIYADLGEEEGVADWQPVAGQRNATISETNDPLDTTTKDTGTGAYEYDYGLSGWTISADGIYVTNNTGFQKLKTAFRNKEIVKVRVKEGATFTEEGNAVITTMDREAPYDDAATYAVELQGTGLLAEVPVIPAG